MYKRVFVVLGLVAGLLLGVNAPASAIINGQPDGSQHPYVGVLWNDVLIGCTGSAVSSTVVVTAAHCLEDGNRFWMSFTERPAAEDNGRPLPSQPGVVTGTGHLINDYCLPAGSCHPGNPGATIKSDVAVVILDTPVNLPRYASLPELGLVDRLPKGQSVTDVGYGVNTITRGGGQPVLGGDPVRETFTAKLQQSSFSGSARYIRLTPTSNHSQVCIGDSGGPLLLGDTLVGVNSFGASPVCTGPSGAARVDLEPILTAIHSYL